MITATSASRVPDHTADRVNEQIRAEARAEVERRAGRPEMIEARLEELDREWDVERVLEVNSAAISLVGLGLGFAVDRRWFLLPLAVQTFFMQHALQGWCPPLPVLRRMGYRTRDEIDRERCALKALRGDFESVSPGQPGDAARAIDACGL